MSRPITLRTWQQEVYNMSIGESDPDHIIWVYNEEGNVGKTELYDYIEENTCLSTFMGGIDLMIL